MSLQSVSQLFILTPNGERKIQLHVGDITKLAPTDKVDIILFPNRHSNENIRTSLSSHLDLDICQLFSNIKEDLRDTHGCWTSQVLSEDCPFRQLLCFEHTDHEADFSVDDFFAPLMQLFDNENHSMIMPLEVPQRKGMEMTTYLKCLIKCASKWMAAGLPLQCLQIVIPETNPDQPKDETTLCINKFQEMVNDFPGICPLPVEPPIQNDVLLIFCKMDHELAESVLSTLKKQKPGLRVKIASKTEDQLQVMMSSKRIVPLLTEGFLKNQSCLHLFSLALCCNRWIKRRLIAPFKMDFQLNLPAYMDIVQWISCTLQNGTKMWQACSQLLNEDTFQETVSPERVLPIKTYDIFLSYSHKDTKMARHVLKQIQQQNPDIKVFFDYDELKTGSMWQQVLYKAVDQSKTMLALVSPEYFESSVCVEEFNIGLAKHLGKENAMLLVPLALRPVQSELFMDHVTCIQPEDGMLDGAIITACCSILNFLHAGNRDKNMPISERVVDVDILSEEQRKRDFRASYLIDSDDDQLVLQRKRSKVFAVDTIPTHPTVICKPYFTIYMSYIASEQRYADFIQKRLLQLGCGLGGPVRFLNSLTSNGALAIEEADLVVAFLSHSYMASPKDLEEFHYILSRARTKSSHFLYPIVIDQLPESPIYARLIPTHCHLKDDLWAEMAQARDLTLSNIWLVNQVTRQHGAPPLLHDHDSLKDTEVMALIKGSYDLQAIIKGSRNYSSYTSPTGLMSNMAHVYTELYGRPMAIFKLPPSPQIIDDKVLPTPEGAHVLFEDIPELPELEIVTPEVDLTAACSSPEIYEVHVRPQQMQVALYRGGNPFWQCLSKLLLPNPLKPGIKSRMKM